MKTVAEIEDAVEKLPAAQLEELVDWLEAFRLRRATPPSIELWLQRARGAARSGATTANIMTLTRGEE